MSCSNSGDYVLFEPIDFNENHFAKSKVTTDSFYYNLEVVLKFYNEEYKKDEKNRIKVKKEKYNDTELMWNYTTKANDDYWLKNHLRFVDSDTIKLK